MLKIEGVSYTLPDDVPLFQNFSMTVNNGEILGLSGKSGIGKTTLAKIIAGYLRADHGQINVQQMKGKSHSVQLIWQHPEQAVNPKWRIDKTLEEAGVPDQSIIKKLNILPEWLYRYPKQLSGGELQRVCIARCLLAQPEFIIADEITTMLDPISQAEIFKILTEHVQQNKIGLVIISHDTVLLDNLCHKVIDFK
ncbi:ABC transporter ATP-binding protein [Gracilibacillus kekensis]|uniref:Peptide/nickel transport system ATP-binding protein n=1 Tax=Gracilibacillus kekensis TaxID=1027249 RepID=A0A1M7PXH1_9BACI|nr:ATP-binding cassette domain-containing protein [Gracilibacillus kekensis]SHN22355.1 peptide/nickel transport system ATP-binding protein [Gracilibacillus kekensis]